MMQVAEKYGWTKIYQLSDVEFFLMPIIQYLPQGSVLNILDAGCGSGFITARLAELGHGVTGIDASPDGIELANQAYPQVRWEVISIYDDLSHLAPVGGGVGRDHLLRGH
jgi:2-polyprenyl-3-methyl-5-hydroxy-6-metoxy-1,4-benzoquinol methylase